MKFGRETEIGCFSGFSGGTNDGSYGSDGSQRTPKVVLHATLGRQSVVVPPHRIEHFLAAHALIARHDVGVRVGEDVADMKRSAHRGRRRVDRVDLRSRARAIESIGTFALPARGKSVFQPLEGWLIWNSHGLLLWKAEGRRQKAEANRARPRSESARSRHEQGARMFQRRCESTAS